MSFKISKGPIDYTDIAKDMTQPNTGALVTFNGIVRNVNNGKDVVNIEYEMYEKMVISNAEKLIKDALESYDIQTVRAVHRMGTISVGELAIWVSVTAMHRGDAFKACEHLMNQFKHNLPIWKKETYVDGVSEWVFCSHHH